jgi:hypothetical protein
MCVPGCISRLPNLEAMRQVGEVSDALFKQVSGRASLVSTVHILQYIKLSIPTDPDPNNLPVISPFAFPSTTLLPKSNL